MLKALVPNTESIQISVAHVFTATLQGMEFKNCGLAIDMNSSDIGGSLSLIDSSCSGTTNVVKTRRATTGDWALVVENFKNDNCGASVIDAVDGSVLLSGSVASAWVMGPIFDSKSRNSSTNSSINGTTIVSTSGLYTNITLGVSTNSSSAGAYIYIARPTSLTNVKGDYFTMQMPQYEDYDISHFSNVKSDFGAVGDGKTDDTTSIQAALIANAGRKITFFPQGTYLIYQTVIVPPGSRIVGEVWSTLNGGSQASSWSFHGTNGLYSCWDCVL